MSAVIHLVAALVLVSPSGALGHELPEPPASVVAWFEEEGLGVVTTSESSGLSPEELTAVELGEPVSVAMWSEEFLAGRRGAEPVTASGEWVAPITRDGAGIGALVASGDDSGGIAGQRVIWDEDLGNALASRLASTFILDEQTSGWFRLGLEELVPITAEARDVLAGTISVTAYQPFLVERRGPDDEPQPLPEDRGPDQLRPVLVTAGIALGVLVSVGAVVWIRRPETP
ncbi:MAG: hypothetical protein ACQERF_01180 [Actinomycetota bacterium]